MPDYNVSSQQLVAALGLLGWTSADLANASGVPEDEIGQFEAGRDLSNDIGRQLTNALEQAGITFLSPNETSDTGGPGVRLSEGPVDEGLRPEDLNAENDG